MGLRTTTASNPGSLGLRLCREYWEGGLMNPSEMEENAGALFDRLFH